MRIIGFNCMYLEIISNTDKNWLAEKLSKKYTFKRYLQMVRYRLFDLILANGLKKLLECIH